MTTETKTDYWAPDPEACPALVLLVDDQALVAAALQRALAGVPGIDLHYCADPLESILIANKLKPTVILLDLVMPQVDGLTLLRKFRANAATARTPIVVLSTQEDAEIKSQLFSAGANDYIVKLPDRLELLARIKYHSMSAWHRIQRDEAFEALRRSQQALVASNTALLAANENLGKATLAKKHFLTSLAGELSPFMQSIVCEADRMMQNGEGKPLHTEALVAMRREAESFGRLITDIKNFSELEAGKVTLELTDFDLKEAIDELLGEMEATAAAKNLYLAALIPPKTPTLLRGDPHKLRQVLAHLILNALKYTNQGGVCLRVSQLGGNNHQAVLCFEVQDTGAGIPLEAQPYIFHPFGQGDGSPSHNGCRPGLGMAICHRLVELMGGHIELESIPGKGSIFNLVLPCMKQESDQPCADAQPEEAVPRHRVLVVDGNEWVRQLIERQFQYLNLHVSGASGAEEAARMLLEPEGRPFDLVFLHAPQEEAASIAAKIRSCHAAAAVPLVLLAPAGSLEGTPLGIDAIWPTPLRQQATLRCIQKTLDRFKGRQA